MPGSESPRVPLRPRSMPLSVFLLVAALSLAIAAHSPAAFAATSGQQVKVCGLGIALDYARVVGTAQNGNQQTWQGVSDDFFSGSITTSGWWWKGHLSVYTSSAWNPAQFVYAGSWDVPATSAGDLYVIDC